MFVGSRTKNLFFQFRIFPKMETSTLTDNTETLADCFEQTQIPFEETGLFSAIFLDYIKEKESLQPFYGNFPKLANFPKQVELKRDFPQQNREILANVLQNQYQGIEDAPTAQIERLRNKKTFTVTTGHQLNIFSGPLYFIYKIVSTINLARQLQAAFPQYHFVPVYWMATEDHDFEEISYFRLFGKKFEWQREAKGAVGRLSTAGLGDLMAEISEMPDFFKSAYDSGKNLAQATREYVHHLFGKHDLLILDADDSKLKSQFVEIMKADIFEQKTSEKALETSQKLEAAGYGSQIFIREINFFYLEDGLRSRIEQQGEDFQIVDTELKFSKEELGKLMETNPEKFSPNVALRPVYQEVILPNLAYLGGPSEVAYWFQLKGIFDEMNVPFPMLMPRNFALVVNSVNSKRMEKLNVSAKDLFQDEDTLRKQFVLENAENEVMLGKQISLLNEAFSQVVSKAVEIDKSLEGFVKAEEQKAIKSLQNIEKRLRKSEERNQETSVKQLLKIKQQLFPDGSPQERKDNFLNFYINDSQFIEKLLNAFNPLDYSMNVLVEK